MTVITERATKVDKHVAARIHKNRVLLGKTNRELAQQVGVSEQQMSKYERAENRISVGALYVIAKSLNTPIEWFFEEFVVGECPPAAPPHTRQTLELIRNFLAIEDEAQQSTVSSLARSLAISSLMTKEKAQKTFDKHEENGCKLDEFSV